MKKYKLRMVVILITLMLKGEIILSQCSGLTQGTTFSTAPVTISTTVTWTTDEYIASNLTITSTGDLTINAKNIKIASDVQIFVQQYGHLTIENGTDIYGEPDGFGSFRLWDGILVEGGGILTMDDSQIFYARIAIQADNSGSDQSELYITNSCFENNDIGVYFGPNAIPDASVSLIESSEFHAPELVDDFDGELGDYGVLINLTDYVYGVQIGNDDEYDEATDNYFHHLGMGIRSLNSDLTVQNCLFEDINDLGNDPDYPAGSPITETTPGFFGINATGDENISIPPYLLTVGSSSATDFNNKMVDVLVGIHAEEYVSTELHYNDISSIPSGTYIMRRGINITDYDVNVSHDIERNQIAWYLERGIDLINVDDGTVLIDNNILINSSTADFGEFAIRITGSSETDVTVSDNEIDAAINGIAINGVEAADVNGNLITFYSPEDFTVSANGIWALNCDDINIADNLIEGNCTTGSCSNKVRGITIDECLDGDADKNNMTDCSVGILLLNDIEGINLSCNEIHDCAKGVWFINVLSPSGTITNPTSPGDPSDNGWYPESTAERVRTQNTGPGCDVSGITWYYRDDPGEDWADIIFVVPVIGSSPPTFDEEEGIYCDQTPRLEDMNDEIDLLSFYFGDWAKEVSEDGIYSDLNLYYRAWNFWDYVKSDEELQNTFDGDFEAAFHVVDSSNIPTFDIIRHLPGNSDLANAITLNNNIIPGNDIETTLQTTNSIYFNNLDESGKFMLNDEISSELRDIVELNGALFGFGVYNACKMLDTLTSINLGEEERIGQLIDKPFFLFPNPAVNYFYIDRDLVDKKILQLDIISTDGTTIQQVDGVTATGLIDVSLLHSGIYNVRITLLNGELFCIKLAIFKPN